MQEHERELHRPGPGGTPASETDPLEATRADTQRMLRAADKVIAKGLSVDSGAYLRVNQQTVGE